MSSAETQFLRMRPETRTGSSSSANRKHSSPHPTQGHLTGGSNGAPTVRIVTLDGLVLAGKLPPPDLIKCDIEGAEYDALMGASGILDKYGPTVFLATHGAEVHQRCCSLLADLHYSLTSLDELPVDRTGELLATRQKA